MDEEICVLHLFTFSFYKTRYTQFIEKYSLPNIYFLLTFNKNNENISCIVYKCCYQLKCLLASMGHLIYNFFLD